MANTFLLKIITPDHEVYNGDIEKIALNSVDGGFEVYANHENMIASTIPCLARFKEANGNEIKLFISKSLVQIKNNEMVVSSDAAEFSEEIDEERAKEALTRAEKRLQEADKYDKKRAEAALNRAKYRLLLKNNKK